MPPRYAYWTILVDDQATAFRSGSQEDLMPTFKRLKEKHPSATMMWFQNGKLWPSRVDAQEAMIGRGEAGRRSDPRQAGTGFRNRERRPTRDRVERTAWTPRGEPSTPAPARNADDKLDWKPKGEFVPAPKRADRPERSERPDWKSKTQDSRPRTSRSEKPEWKPKGSFDRESKPAWKPKGSVDRERKPDWKPKGSFDRESKPAWKPKGSFDRESKPAWKPKGSFDREHKPDWKPKGSFDREHKPDWKPKASYGSKPAGRREWTPRDEKPRSKNAGATFRPPAGERKERGERLEWSPKSAGPQARKPESPPEKRKWVPKEEYKKSMGIEAKRDGKWRPGGEHRDPRQKYKDAKKAKWTKFKKTIRAKSETKKKKP